MCSMLLEPHKWCAKVKCNGLKKGRWKRPNLCWCEKITTVHFFVRTATENSLWLCYYADDSTIFNLPLHLNKQGLILMGHPSRCKIEWHQCNGPPKCVKEALPQGRTPKGNILNDMVCHTSLLRRLKRYFKGCRKLMHCISSTFSGYSTRLLKTESSGAAIMHEMHFKGKMHATRIKGVAHLQTFIMPVISGQWDWNRLNMVLQPMCEAYK